MQGNWSAGPDPVSAPAKGQQHQHQHQHQQINLVDGRSGSAGEIPHSPATPGWNIADRIVKEELPEDKNNDSGVSPGHYTSNSVSPRSRRSSTANGSLSPGSATSQDSNAIMQYEYSPQRIFKSCVSPLGFGHSAISNGGNRSPKLQSPTLNYANGTDAMMQIMPQGNNRGIMMQNGNEQNVDMVSSTMKPESDDSDTTAMQCPICTFSTVHRMQFNEHLASHCSPKCVDSGDFSSSNYTNLSSLSEDGARGSPSQGDRSEHEFEDLDEPGLRVPRVNCQGKVKTFRCKQCNFVAITKLEFWEHSRGHIKAEKLLTCPKCPFVTEYKHHLEYHLRNHFGSKPFKCDKCSYSCVNKSMLNSHLKSHSNVYQYRCAECSYATKYCHSLKLHLRKYSHKPAMVLNPDGSPNPLPIIDIYGTRRGPKQKTTLKTSEDGINMGPVGVTGGASVIKMAGGQFMEQNVHQAQLGVPFPYSQILNAAAVNFPVNFLHHQLSQCDNNNEKNNNRESITRGFELFGKIQEYTNGGSVFEHQDIKRLSPTLGNGILPGFEATDSPLPMDYPEDEPEMSVASPLDLSKPDLSQNCKTNSPRSSGTSRRKGRAFKLDKLVVAQDSEDEISPVDQEDDQTMKQVDSPESRKSECVTNGFKIDQNSLSPNHDKEISSEIIASAGSNSDYNCQYCDIAFGNVVMYTMHMGYHGYKNPYTCNMCGHQCNDKVSFFLHIARDSHS